jgi:protein ImuB
VPAKPHAVDLTDADGAMVTVTGRGMASAPPVALGIRGRSLSIVGWAGPWPVDERWWDADDHRRRARFQILTEDGQARLVVLEQGQWWVAALWD